jgi:hypothetical protein
MRYFYSGERLNSVLKTEELETQQKVSSLNLVSKQLHAILNLNMKDVRAEVEIPYRIKEADKLDTLMSIANKTEDMKRV